MRMINLWRVAFAILAAFSLASCSSDEPQWADPESHEKTEQLRKQYTPIIAGTWHVEYIKDKGRFFEHGRPANSSPSTARSNIRTGRKKRTITGRSRARGSCRGSATKKVRPARTGSGSRLSLMKIMTGLTTPTT